MVDSATPESETPSDPLILIPTPSDPLILIPTPSDPLILIPTPSEPLILIPTPSEPLILIPTPSDPLILIPTPSDPLILIPETPGPDSSIDTEFLVDDPPPTLLTPRKGWTPSWEELPRRRPPSLITAKLVLRLLGVVTGLVLLAMVAGIGLIVLSVKRQANRFHAEPDWVVNTFPGVTVKTPVPLEAVEPGMFHLRDLNKPMRERWSCSHANVRYYVMIVDFQVPIVTEGLVKEAITKAGGTNVEELEPVTISGRFFQRHVAKYQGATLAIHSTRFKTKLYIFCVGYQNSAEEKARLFFESVIMPDDTSKD